MDKFTDYLFGTLLLISWILGFVIAKGFWSTFFCWIPFYAWYLDIEWILSINNLI